jgi:hypothetical protein
LGSWATSALKIDQTYLKQKTVCNAKDATAEELENLGHACLDWNAGSAPMEAAAIAYRQRVGLSESEAPIFAVGSVGHERSNFNMGKCFEFALEGVSRALLLQAVNEGWDVDSGDIDVMMGAGGEGDYTGCTSPGHGADPMFAQTSGTQYSYPGAFGDSKMSGGPATRSKCADLPKWPSDIAESNLPGGAETLIEHCQASFNLNLRPADSALSANPLILSRKWVACPSEMVQVTKFKRWDEPASPITQASPSGARATRMMDCCKPSAGFVANNLNFDQNYPAVLSCKADGFTRMDGSMNPFASTTPGVTAGPAVTTTLVVTTSLAATTIPAAATTPAATTTVSDTCIVKFFEGNGNNNGEWTYTATVKAGKTFSKDWKKSNKNDELTSLCISQPGCKVELYENKKWKGVPKFFVGGRHNKGCGTFISKGDLNTRQGIQGVGITGRFNDKVTSWRVTAAGR